MWRCSPSIFLFLPFCFRNYTYLPDLQSGNCGGKWKELFLRSPQPSGNQHTSVEGNHRLCFRFLPLPEGKTARFPASGSKKRDKSLTVNPVYLSRVISPPLASAPILLFDSKLCTFAEAAEAKQNTGVRARARAEVPLLRFGGRFGRNGMGSETFRLAGGKVRPLQGSFRRRKPPTWGNLREGDGDEGHARQRPQPISKLSARPRTKRCAKAQSAVELILHLAPCKTHARI